jgi:hypothetical protein
MKSMVLRDPSRPVSVIHHEHATYRPKKGVFEVEDGHVNALRAHGLRLDSEESELGDAKAAIADKDKTIADLTARIEALEKAGKK